MVSDRTQREIDAAKQGDSDYRNRDTIGDSLGLNYNPPEGGSEREIYIDHHDNGPNATKNPGK